MEPTIEDPEDLTTLTQTELYARINAVSQHILDISTQLENTPRDQWRPLLDELKANSAQLVLLDKEEERRTQTRLWGEN